MTPTALLARLTARGYRPASHDPAGCPASWLDLRGKAGSIRVVTYPDDERAEVYGLRPEPARTLVFDVRLSAGAPEAVTVATLNAAEAWLAEPDTATTTATTPPPASPEPPASHTSRNATMRSFEEIRKLIQETGASPRSPIAQMIMTTAWKLNTTRTQITEKITTIRDALDRVEHKLRHDDPCFASPGELQRTPADLDLLLARAGLLSDQLGMLVEAARETTAS
jgi:hypothetical protein